MKQYNNKSLNMSYRDFSQVLKANGYSLSRQKGDHAVWVKAGKCSISINFRKPNMMVMRRLIKENNLNF